MFFDSTWDLRTHKIAKILHAVLDQGHKHYVKRFTCFFEIHFQKIVKSASIQKFRTEPPVRHHKKNTAQPSICIHSNLSGTKMNQLVDVNSPNVGYIF